MPVIYREVGSNKVIVETWSIRFYEFKALRLQVQRFHKYYDAEHVTT
jgi:hypothetical protein